MEEDNKNATVESSDDFAPKVRGIVLEEFYLAYLGDLLTNFKESVKSDARKRSEALVEIKSKKIGHQ